MSAYAIDLRCYLHGQVFVGRYLFAGGKTQVKRCWLQDIGGLFAFVSQTDFPAINDGREFLLSFFWSFKYKLPDSIHAANHLKHTEEIALVHLPRSAQCPAVGSLWQHIGKYGEDALRVIHLLALGQVDRYWWCTAVGTKSIIVGEYIVAP